MAAKVRNYSAYIAEVFDKWEPIKMVEWRGMKKDDRNAASAIEIVETSSVGKVRLGVHPLASAHLYERCLVFVTRGRGADRSNK
jgi:hypothetical protein